MEKYKLVRRRFSDEFKRQKVKEIDHGLIRVRDVVREYGVSGTSVYKWLHKYSIHYERKSFVVVQMKSEQEKVKKLRQRLSELERIVGQKQMRIDYLEKLIELVGDEYDLDIEKKGELPRLNGLDKTKKNTAGK